MMFKCKDDQRPSTSKGYVSEQETSRGQKSSVKNNSSNDKVT